MRFRRRGSFLTGCLVTLGVLLLIAIGVGVWVAMSWKGWAADLARSVTEDAVAKSTLPQDQRDRIIARIDGVATDFEGGKITLEQLSNVFESVAESPLLALGLISGVDAKFLEGSSLTAEEKSAGRRSMERFARGVAEGKITPPQLEDTILPITVADPNQPDQRRLKDTVTTEDLKTFLERAKSQADKAEIPDEPFTVNIADELDKVIDAGLGKK